MPRGATMPGPHVLHDGALRWVLEADFRGAWREGQEAALNARGRLAVFFGAWHPHGTPMGSSIVIREAAGGYRRPGCRPNLEEVRVVRHQHAGVDRTAPA